jgi:hypothetical protein
MPETMTTKGQAEERQPLELPESTRAVIDANVKKWAARPIPDHIRIQAARIFNSGR